MSGLQSERWNHVHILHMMETCVKCQRFQLYWGDTVEYFGIEFGQASMSLLQFSYGLLLGGIYLFRFFVKIHE